MPVSIVTDFIDSHAQIHKFLEAKFSFDIFRKNSLLSINSIEIFLHFITFVKDVCFSFVLL